MASNNERLTDPGNPAVNVTDLYRSFDGTGSVLNGVNLQIARGEFVALLGRSGSGKSTLLRAVAGLDDKVSGHGVIEVPDTVSVVFQDSRLLPWQRVAENVGLGMPVGEETRAKVRQGLAEVELTGKERAWPHELSGGEQQRAALARSLVRSPELLLADEPFGALDALTKIRMHGLLRELCAVHHPAVLLITHDVAEAIALADRIVVLDRGQIAVETIVDFHHDDPDYPSRAAKLQEQLLTELGVVTV